MASQSSSHKHQARKRFGQNFLQHEGIIRQIIRAIHPQPQQTLVEIGPGLGAITEYLLAAAQQLHVVELDRDLIPRLQSRFGQQYPDLHIHSADALTFDYGSINQQPASMRLVGNLPYNISTPLIFHLLTFAALIQDMHFMLQKEVVLRMAAQVDDNNYGRLSIMVQYFCQVENLFLVPPEAFNPKPKVDSAIVRLTPHTWLPHTAKDFCHFENLVRTAFSQRRKTLRNNLKGICDIAQLDDLGIDYSLRPERLSVADYVKISNHYAKVST